jgi:hypothetical protein
MPGESHEVALRIRLATPTWQQLKRRASQRSSAPGKYADMVFRYALHEQLRVASNVAAVEAEERVYVEVEVPHPTREHLVHWSHRHQGNLATFSGSVLKAFFDRYEKDPRDLVMMHLLLSSLDRAAVLSEAELRQAIEHCQQNTSVRLPPGYFGKWLYGRIKPLLSSLHRDGSTVTLTPEVLEQLLAKRE